jgi:hypothetical protein
MAPQRSIGQVGVCHARVGPRVSRDPRNALVVGCYKDVVKRPGFSDAVDDAGDHGHPRDLG